MVSSPIKLCIIQLYIDIRRHFVDSSSDILFYIMKVKCFEAIDSGTSSGETKSRFRSWFVGLVLFFTCVRQILTEKTTLTSYLVV